MSVFIYHTYLYQFTIKNFVKKNSFMEWRRGEGRWGLNIIFYV